jgi:NAD(P)-dependent dehydrogenase (short-subunit alcohol dehydrogenase family)
VPNDPLPAEARGAAPGRGRLQGRRLLVVGAGTQPSPEPEAPVGNGRAIAVLAGREGAAVACADLDATACGATVDLLTAEGSTAVGLAGDASVDEDAAGFVADAVASLGGLDGLVVNVGVTGGQGLRGTSVETWDRILAVNARSHFLALRHALPVLPHGGSVVLVSSLAGFRSGSRMPAYDASKAALAGLCRHAAGEAARHGVRVNLVVPGLIDTPLGRSTSRDRPGRDRAPVPLGRHGTAWEVAYATVFLLSDESSYSTGQALFVDGGFGNV